MAEAKYQPFCRDQSKLADIRAMPFTIAIGTF